MVFRIERGRRLYSRSGRTFLGGGRPRWGRRGFRKKEGTSFGLDRHQTAGDRHLAGLDHGGAIEAAGHDSGVGEGQEILTVEGQRR